MENNKQSHKITDEQFLEALMESKGNCGLAAQIIQKKYNVTYSRQAVFLRAKNFNSDAFDILRLLDDHYEEYLIRFADDEVNNINLRTRIYIHLRNKVGKQIEKFEREMSKPKKRNQVYKIGGKILSFEPGADNSEVYEYMKNKKSL